MPENNWGRNVQAQEGRLPRRHLGGVRAPSRTTCVYCEIETVPVSTLDGSSQDGESFSVLDWDERCWASTRISVSEYVGIECPPTRELVDWPTLTCRHVSNF